MMKNFYNFLIFLFYSNKMIFPKLCPYFNYFFSVHFKIQFICNEIFRDTMSISQFLFKNGTYENTFI